jgi:hypothetical protein
MTTTRTTDESRGYLTVITEASTYTLRRAEYDALKAALAAHRRAELSGDPDQAGEAEQFFEGEDNYGATVLIDLALVEGVVDFSRQALERKDQEDRMLRIRGGDFRPERE